MSRPRYYWHGIARKMIQRYPMLGEERSMQAAIFRQAIDEALDETAKLPNGELRLAAIKDVLIDQTRTLYGEAAKVNYSEKTVQNWINSFVRLVGKKAGY